MLEAWRFSGKGLGGFKVGGFGNGGWAHLYLLDRCATFCARLGTRRVRDQKNSYGAFVLKISVCCE